jgi:hypothetical protein
VSSWPRDEFEKFVALLEKKLDVGAQQYGDASFSKHGVKIIDDVMEELMDVCGWSFVLYVKVNRLKERLANWESHAERRLQESHD